MCLVHLLFGVHPDLALLLAGNRDEFYRRPSAPPRKIGENPVVHAGLDLEAGGTWMGRNEFGLHAAITNRRSTERAIPDAPLSRGAIVSELLRQPSPAQAAQWVADLSVSRYRPFNVLFGDAQQFFFFSSEEGGAPRALEPGFHALSNSTLDDMSWPKVARSHAFYRNHGQSDGETFLRQAQLFFLDATRPDRMESDEIAEEIHGALGAVFIRTETYGTVSSTIMTAGGTIGERYYFATAAEMRKAQSQTGRSAYRLMTFAE